MCGVMIKGSLCALVTVGTTQFDALTIAADSKELVHLLRTNGYKKLILQVGASKRVPVTLCPDAESDSEGRAMIGDFEVEWFRYTPSLKSILESSSLVISHAGAGSIFESLSSPGVECLIAIPNDALMDNHQADLANHLSDQGYLYTATPETLIDLVKEFLKNGPPKKAYEAHNAIGIAAHIHSQCFPFSDKST